MRKFYIESIDLYLNERVDKGDFHPENMYDFENQLNESEFEKFREFVIDSMLDRKYFECIIDGEVKEVRFGTVSHRQTEGGIIVEGPIVEKAYDDEDEPEQYGNNFQANIEKEIIKTRIINDRLVDLLLEKEVITSIEKEELLKVGRKEIATKYFDYNTF